MKKIVLASVSPKRKELLERTGLSFDVVPSNYEEDMTLDLTPGELVKFLSKGKAEDVGKKYDDAVIISADTIVYFQNQVIGKPYTVEKARETLLLLSGKQHSIFTGFTVLDTKESKLVSKAVETKVFFKKIPEAVIEEYIKRENPLKFAGAYTLEDVGDLFVEKVEGYESNVIGLPIEELMKTLKEFGIFVG